MLHSFVVGVTPDKKRHPLFVGTIGEARAFAEKAEAAQGQVGETWYEEVRVFEAVQTTHVFHFDPPSVVAPKPPAKPAATPRKKQEPPAPATPPPSTPPEPPANDDHDI